jgi:hypothetical protein
VFDESIERADRLTRLIDDAVRSETSPGEPRDDGDPR